MSRQEDSIKIDVTKLLKSSKQYKSIKKSLIEQLEFKGESTPYFKGLVGDYMSMWVAKELLNQDIEERGVIVTYDNGGGQSGQKKNDSITDFVKTNAQMLKLLSELGIKTGKVSTGGDEL